MSLALYRKYRPGTFAEVKGQEHVTEPLRQALRTGRIHHAYLFSGPRGCGKTSSARILARSLNCEKGPTPDPCGECESCVALAPTGPGHLDVIEIDAASHGGVDDARDLRERAIFAPVSARYKIYIIDEAHMVTREGFNALLKLVEEPPPHLKFVFATTEPDKVIGTIKSRTHHYPFRLLPPSTLRKLIEEILQAEGVPYEPAALEPAIRAGGGSARDTLSILDQLLAGSDERGITYQRAIALLGYTDADLLDEIVDAFARRDGAAVFQTVHRVIEGGHDPRRFATDLLERFRDLVVLANVPDAAEKGLLDRPEDELERLKAQAAAMGPAELTRAAEVFNAGLIEMRGAVSPRLQLELMCARVLLPAADEGEASILARLERLERGGLATAAAAAPAPPVAQAPAAVPAQPSGGPAPAAPAVPPQAQPAGGPAPSRGAATPVRPADDWPEPVRPGAPRAAQQPAPAPARPAPAAPAVPPGSPAAAAVQQAWPRVLEAVKQRQRVTWSILSTEGQVIGVEGTTVTLGFERPGTMKGFLAGKRDEVVAAALGEVLGGQWRVEAVVGGTGAPAPAGGAPAARRGGPAVPSGGPAAPGPAARTATAGVATAGGPQPAPGAGATAPTTPGPVTAPGPVAGNGGGAAGGPAAGNGAAVPAAAPAPNAARPQPPTTDESWPDAPIDDYEPEPPGPPPGPATAQPRPRPAGGGGAAAWPDAIPGRRGTSDLDEVDPDNDLDAEGDGLVGLELIKRELGGEIIDEIDHSA